MSIINSQPLIGASGQGGYFLSKSLRFRSSASASLSRTFGTPTSTTTWSLSFWLKRGNLTANAQVFSAGGDFIYFGGGTFAIKAVSGAVLETTQVFRDPSAWYHFLVVADTSNATANNRVRLYVNGTEVTAFSSRTNPSLSAATIFNASSSNNRIGGTGSTEFYDGYLAEVNFIDGQALTPSSFGQTSATTGVWIPKKYTGTYGNNGFYLDFEDTSSTAALGYDAAGSNDWTVNNISLTSGSTYDSMKDVPTLTDTDTANYPTLNPLSKSSSSNLSGGNLNWSSSAYNYQGATSTTALPSSGKWYWETFITTGGTATSDDMGIGVQALSLGTAPKDNNTITDGAVIVSRGDSASRLRVNNTSIQTGTSYSFTTNDIIQVAFDADSGKIWFGKNNSYFDASGGTTGNPASGTNPVGTLTAGSSYLPVWDGYTNTYVIAVNFGQRPFAYTPPTGFKALNTFNLPTPTIGATASSQANDYFDVTLYTGNSTTNNIVNAGGFKPDLVWIKSRSNGQNHNLFDVNRGAGYVLFSSSTSTELDNTAYFTSFNSNGFSLASNGGDTNFSGYTYVAWQWKANGTGVTNTAGSITSTVSANTTAGFSVVTYTGTGSNATVGHGLGVAPSMIIIKSRVNAFDWVVYHASIGNTAALRLNTTAASDTDSTWFNNSSPSSTTFTLGNTGGVNNSSSNFVAYCFAEVAGYSAFGSYTGNGSADGTFVFTGFRPRFILFKNTQDNTTNWIIMDTTRTTSNVMGARLDPNAAAAEATLNTVDFLSNGFKLRNSAGLNQANTYIYAAFAESPFKYSLAR